ncbi:MAG: potassium channel family protein [archaeon]
MIRKITYALILLTIFLVAGTLYYHNTEQWSYTDSFYFSTMTLTTVGYGDFAPTQDSTKIFTSFYAIFGIGIMLYMMISVIGVSLISMQPLKKTINILNKLKQYPKFAKKTTIKEK